MGDRIREERLLAALIRAKPLVEALYTLAANGLAQGALNRGAQERIRDALKQINDAIMMTPCAEVRPS